MTKTAASTAVPISKKLYNIFSRKTSGGKFIPEIDGLRFFAIASVVLFHTFKHYFEKTGTTILHADNLAGHLAANVLGNFGRGVELFFAISGFILALPFANAFLKNSKKPGLKKYFLRRVTRLEPPYIVSLILFFVLNYVTHHNSPGELFRHFAASFFYCHNFIYPGTLPLINGVTWSLEIEIQFYILAPLLTSVFMIGNKLKRRALLFSSIIVFILLNQLAHFNAISILNYFHYFMIGFLIADFYLEEDFVNFFPVNKLLGFAAGIVMLAGIFFFPNGAVAGYILPASIFCFFYLCMFSASWKMVANLKLLTVIGGMCYSIYLLHVYIIALADRFNIGQYLHAGIYTKFFLHVIVCIVLVLMVSSFYFITIEKPCMDKDWVKNLVNKFRKKSTVPSN